MCAVAAAAAARTLYRQCIACTFVRLLNSVPVSVRARLPACARCSCCAAKIFIARENSHFSVIEKPSHCSRTGTRFDSPRNRMSMRKRKKQREDNVACKLSVCLVSVRFSSASTCGFSWARSAQPRSESSSAERKQRSQSRSRVPLETETKNNNNNTFSLKWPSR